MFVFIDGTSFGFGFLKIASSFEIQHLKLVERRFITGVLGFSSVEYIKYGSELVVYWHTEFDHFIRGLPLPVPLVFPSFAIFIVMQTVGFGVLALSRSCPIMSLRLGRYLVTNSHYRLTQYTHSPSKLPKYVEDSL